MTPDSYNFTGDTVTYLGFVGIISTAIILVSVFRSFNWLYQRNKEIQLKIDKEIDRLHGTPDELAGWPPETDS